MEKLRSFYGSGCTSLFCSRFSYGLCSWYCSCSFRGIRVLALLPPIFISRLGLECSNVQAELVLPCTRWLSSCPSNRTLCPMCCICTWFLSTSGSHGSLYHLSSSTALDSMDFGFTRTNYTDPSRRWCFLGLSTLFSLFSFSYSASKASEKVATESFTAYTSSPLGLLFP